MSGYLCSDSSPLQQPTAKASFTVTEVRPSRTGENTIQASNTWVSSKEFGLLKKHLTIGYLFRKARDYRDSTAEAYVQKTGMFISIGSIFQIQNHESIRMFCK